MKKQLGTVRRIETIYLSDRIEWGKENLNLSQGVIESEIRKIGTTLW